MAAGMHSLSGLPQFISITSILLSLRFCSFFERSSNLVGNELRDDMICQLSAKGYVRGFNGNTNECTS